MIFSDLISSAALFLPRVAHVLHTPCVLCATKSKAISIELSGLIKESNDAACYLLKIPDGIRFAVYIRL
jgi:hypothetical protein